MITPALTPGEWASDTVTRTASSGDTLVIVRDGPVRQEAGGHFHALAAVALHNQSFGFTRRDADRLRSGMLSDDERASLADRITALLQPE